MEVLSVTSELFPLIKTGGLADVAGALPPALAGEGIAVTTLVPGYPAVMEALPERTVFHRYGDLHGGKAELARARVADLDLWVLEAPHLYLRAGSPYGDSTGQDWPDNARRFAALSRAGADLAQKIVADYQPDIVHAHDWQAAMTLAYLRYGPPQPIPTVMTVHNLAFQGQFPASVFPLLGLPPHAMALDGVEYYGGVGFLKGGLQAASAITTVSPTYAREIRTPAFGMGLDGLLNLRSADLTGIVNGIDVSIWNPATDVHLARTYEANTLAGRAANKRALEERFALEHDGAPLFCVVSRLTWQKGMDILAAVVDGIIAMGGKLAILGSGDQALEGALLAAAARHRGRMGMVIGYDEPLSHLLQGGSDAILIPSRFEPCGLTQLYGLRYGCVPLVARTGGLTDTVVDANEAALTAGVATGIQFDTESADALTDAVRRAIAVYEVAEDWKSVQLQGMKADVSWQRSARRYAALYKRLLSKGPPSA